MLLAQVPVATYGSESIRRAQAEASIGDETKIEALRRQCETIIGFTEYRYPRYRTSKVHRFIAAQLERVERGEIDRLMLRLPPRHGKSELASRNFPAYCIGRKPWRQFIAASATADLAREFGREVRNIIETEAYQAVYSTRLAQDSKAANKWNTSEGGSWYSIGVGGDILGRGAHIALIDDPFGSMKDARSPVMRENVWNWYNGSLYNRMEPDGAIVIIGHRMHEDDLQGRLEERMRAHDEYADQWTIVELPAVAGQHDQLGREPGEALWPEHFSLPRLERIRFNSLARNWSALYQQRPTPEEGELFAVERMTMRDHTSDVVFWVRGWDLAGSVEGDWTVGVLMGRTRDGKFVIGDVRRLRGRPDAVEQAIQECARADTRRTRVSIPKDPGQAGVAQVLALTKMLAGYVVLSSPETGGKQTRAEPLAAQVNVGNVTMIPGDWNHAYREELRSFPYGKYDDQVDASSRAFMELTATKGPMIINKDMLRHA